MSPNIDELLTTARQGLDRIEAAQAAAELEEGALLVDTRPADQRAEDGEIPGATVIDRNVLEWRLDPASPSRIAAACGYDIRVIVICNEGYSSSLAAATLKDLASSTRRMSSGGFRPGGRQACRQPKARS